MDITPYIAQIENLKAELAKSEEDVDVLCRKLSECQQQRDGLRAALQYYVNAYPYLVEDEDKLVCEHRTDEAEKNLRICTCYGCIAYRKAKAALAALKEEGVNDAL